MSTNQVDNFDLDALAALLTASPDPLPTGSAVPASDLWSRGRALRRRRNALTVAASVVTVLGVGSAGIGVMHARHDSGRQTQQLAAGGSNDFARRAQDWLGGRWTLTSQQSLPATVNKPAPSSGFVYFGNTSKNVSDVLVLALSEGASTDPQPYPRAGHVRIETARYSQPTPDEAQVAAYARIGGPASHFPDDGTRPALLIERTPTANSHLWVVQMPDKNSLIGLLWQSDGRVTQIIAPGGDTPPLDASAIASLAAALAQN